MNRRCFAWTGLILCLVLRAPLAAQTTPGISKEAKNAPDATAYKPVIDAFIKTQVEHLRDKSATVQHDAREALSNEIGPVGPDGPSASYFSVYAGSLDAALKPLIVDKNMRCRLNAAIVVARVSRVVDNDQLKGSAEALLQDKSDAVAVWAMKAVGKNILRYYLNNPRNKPPTLLATMVHSVENHRSAAVAQEAYDAASLGLPDTAKDVTDEMIKQVIPEMQQLLMARIDRYVETMPEEPQSERQPTSFFALSRVWQSHTPAQKIASIQSMYNLIGVCSERAVGASPEDRKQLVATISATNRALQVIGDNMNDPAIVAAAKQLGQSTPGTTDIDIVTRVRQLEKDIDANAAFKDNPLQAFPVVKPLQRAAPVTNDNTPAAPTSAPDADAK